MCEQSPSAAESLGYKALCGGSEASASSEPAPRRLFVLGAPSAAASPAASAASPALSPPSSSSLSSSPAAASSQAHGLSQSFRHERSPLALCDDVAQSAASSSAYTVTLSPGSSPVSPSPSPSPSASPRPAPPLVKLPSLPALLLQGAGAAHALGPASSSPRPLFCGGGGLVPGPPALGFELRPLEEREPVDERDRALMRRRAVAYEILESERSYLHQLNILTTVFLGQMRSMGFDSTLLFNIFSNAEVIRNCHEKLFDKLRKRVGSWDDDSVMADIFLNEANWIKLYKYYINNYTVSVNAVKKLRDNSALFKAWAKRVERTPELGGLDLNSFLVTPVQRIPRYVLLLQDMCKWTPEWHPDKQLPDALAYIKELADYINERKRESEKVQELQNIQSRIVGFHGDLTLMPGRMFLKEATLIVDRAKCHAFVFSDIVIITKAEKKGTFKFKCLIQLKTAAIQREQTPCFKLFSSEGVLSCEYEHQDVELFLRLLETCADKSRESLIRSAFVDESSTAGEGSAQYLEAQNEQFMRQRSAAFGNLVASERLYVDTLERTHTNYLEPMKTLFCASAMLNSAGTFDLALEYETMIAFHKKMLQELEALEKGWSNETTIGQLFVEKQPSLLFYAHYTSNHGKNMDHLGKCLLETESFLVWLRERESERHEDLAVLLEKPLGRIADYYLQLQEVLQYTPKKHADYRSLSDVVSAMLSMTEDLARRGTASKSGVFHGTSCPASPRSPKSPVMGVLSLPASP
eukprot:m51a1_g8671 putative domain containing protein (752) ;mRNA; f:125282-128863